MPCYSLLRPSAFYDTLPDRDMEYDGGNVVNLFYSAGCGGGLSSSVTYVLADLRDLIF